MLFPKEKIIQGAKGILQDKSFYGGKLIFSVRLPVEAYKKKAQE